MSVSPKTILPRAPSAARQCTVQKTGCGTAPATGLGQGHALLRTPAPVHIRNRREEPPADQTKRLEPEAIDEGLAGP